AEPRLRQRRSAAARRGPQAARGDGAVRRDPRGSVLLAARRHPQGCGDARLPRGGERLRRHGDGAARPAAGDAVRGDRRPDQAGRQLGAVPRARLLVLHPLRDRAGLPDPRAAARRAGPLRRGRERRGAARRPRDGARQGLLQPGDYDVTPDNSILAWAEADVGPRQDTIRFRNLATGETYPDVITGVSPNLVWADDNRTVFYVENDPETLLTKRVRKHVLGTPVADDPLVYEELDDSFYMGIDRTRDDRFICISVGSTVSSEMRCAPAADPREFTVFAPRERDVEYQADHLGDRWVIRTNAPGADGKPAANFKPATAPTDATTRAQWTDLVPHRDDLFIEDYDLFDTFIAIGERSGGLERIRLLKADGEEYVAADEPAYSMGLDVNSEPDTPWLRYSYTSLTTPATTYEVNTATGERRLLKQQPVIGYDPSQYTTERLWATARDGTKIPVSIVYRKGFRKDGTAALLQYAYGSYGYSMDPGFNLPVVSLLDRGMAYAIAHIRGGQEMGRAWYDQGTLLHKKNTFTDFVDLTDFLVAEGYAAKDRVAAYGGSAGGLLMGAVANMAPDRYRVILSQVPFVDVVTTMLDPSIPLTTNEYDEWGNPEQREYYDYMLSYS